MFSQTTITRFKNYRAANIERDMGGVTTGPVAVLHCFFLLAATWGSLVGGLAILVGILKLAGSSVDVALISFFAFVLLWLGLSFTNFHSRLIDWLVAFFEAGLLTVKIRIFRLPISSETPTYLFEYVSLILGVPTNPPRSIA